MMGEPSSTTGSNLHQLAAAAPQRNNTPLVGQDAGSGINHGLSLPSPDRAKAAASSIAPSPVPVPVGTKPLPMAVAACLHAASTIEKREAEGGPHRSLDGDGSFSQRSGPERSCDEPTTNEQEDTGEDDDSDTDIFLGSNPGSGESMTVEQILQRMDELKQAYRRHMQAVRRLEPRRRKARTPSPEPPGTDEDTDSNSKDSGDAGEHGDAGDAGESGEARRSGRTHRPPKLFHDEIADDSDTSSGPSRSRAAPSSSSSASADADPGDGPTHPHDAKKRGRTKNHPGSGFDEKHADSNSNSGESDGKSSTDEAVVYSCPWPGCNRTFDKVKSRSAHLKWHGGDYKAGEQDRAGQGPDRKKEKEKTRRVTTSSAPATTTTTTSTTHSSAAKHSLPLPKPAKKRAKKTALATRLNAGDTVVLYRSEQQPSIAGKFGTIDALLPQSDGFLNYRVAVTLKGRLRHITCPEYLLALTGSANATNVNNSTTFEVGAKVYGGMHTSHGTAYRPGVILERRSGAANELTQYRFRPYNDTSSSAWLTTRDIVADVAPTIAQLRTGMKVCALTEKTGTMHYAGTIQRIETSRIRVNFERFSIAWRKAHEVRVLKA